MNLRKDCSRCRRTAKSKGETFWCYNKTYIFDVDRARKLIAKGDREFFELDPGDVLASVDRCEINKRHVGHVDPDIPGIVAHIYHPDDNGELVHGHRLIDGHHRAARCLELKRPFVVRILTEEESVKILMKAPEGAKPKKIPSRETAISESN